MSEEMEELRKLLIEHKREADEERLIGVSACCKSNRRYYIRRWRR